MVGFVDDDGVIVPDFVRAGGCGLDRCKNGRGILVEVAAGCDACGATRHPLLESSTQLVGKGLPSAQDEDPVEFPFVDDL